MATSGAPRPSKWNKGQSHLIKWDSFLLARQSNYKVHYSNELGYSGGANEGQEGEKSCHWSKTSGHSNSLRPKTALGRIVERMILGREWHHPPLYLHFNTRIHYSWALPTVCPQIEPGWIQVQFWCTAFNWRDEKSFRSTWKVDDVSYMNFSL